jgi:hypothetical protein
VRREWTVDVAQVDDNDEVYLDRDAAVQALLEVGSILDRLGGGVVIVQDRVQVDADEFATGTLRIRWNSHVDTPKPQRRQPDPQPDPEPEPEAEVEVEGDEADVELVGAGSDD